MFWFKQTVCGVKIPINFNYSGFQYLFLFLCILNFCRIFMFYRLLIKLNISQ